MNKATIITILILIMSFGVALYVYPMMPDQVASHWDSEGNVNGYMSKFWGVFLMPIVMLAMLLLLLFIPRLDPLKENVKKFRKYFDLFILIICLFFLYIYALTLAWNFGYKFNMSTMMIPAMAFLFFCIGILLEKAKRNWFIGIRNPWTLSSDYVWDATHKLAAKLFKILGLIVLLALISPEDGMMYFLLAPILTVIVILFVYSYKLYKKNPKKRA